MHDLLRPAPTATGRAHSRDRILSTYMAEVERIPKLSIAEEKALLVRVSTGDRAAVNALVSSNLKFVVAVSWNYRNRGLAISDLINEGNLGLFRAAENFDSGNGFRFISYAVWWIRQGMLSALARQPGSLSIPSDRMSKAIRFRHVESKLTHRLGRAPREDEMTEALGASPTTTASLGFLLESLASTRGSRSADGSSQPEFTAPEEEGGPEASAESHLLRKALVGELERLQVRERRVLTLRYGFQGACLSLKEIGSIIGVTRERIRQIERKALERLRRSLPAVLR